MRPPFPLPLFGLAALLAVIGALLGSPEFAGGGCGAVRASAVGVLRVPACVCLGAAIARMPPRRHAPAG